MGFKSNNYNPFKIGGLIFDSEEDYLILKNIDKNINHIVHLVNNGSLDLEDVFKHIKPINVKEIYFNASEELDGLFINATNLLVYEDTRFINDYKVACIFFSKINVIYDRE